MEPQETDSERTAEQWLEAALEALKRYADRVYLERTALNTRVASLSLQLTELENKVANLGDTIEEDNSPTRSSIKDMIKDVLRDDCEIEIDASLRVSSW